jgi:hypothetical protein
MPFGRTDAEALGKTIQELRGERDFRHQDQGLSFAPDIFGHGLEVDFRLARTCDAVE